MSIVIKCQNNTIIELSDDWSLYLYKDRLLAEDIRDHKIQFSVEPLKETSATNYIVSNKEFGRLRKVLELKAMVQLDGGNLQLKLFKLLAIKNTAPIFFTTGAIFPDLIPLAKNREVCKRELKKH